MPGLGAWLGAGLGPRARDGKGWAGYGVVRAARAPMAGAGSVRGVRSMPFVCVQPMVTSWSRRAEDLTFDKTDDKDAVLIAWLTAQLRCYMPEPVDET